MSRQFQNGRTAQGSFQSGPITRIELRMFHPKLESYFAIGRQALKLAHMRSSRAMTAKGDSIGSASH
jgi:hypothetical protein